MANIHLLLSTSKSTEFSAIMELYSCCYVAAIRPDSPRLHLLPQSSLIKFMAPN